MPAYVIVQEIIHDEEMFSEYRKHVIPTFGPYGGRFLSRGGALTVLEGKWDFERTVILEFPSRDKAEAWYHSPEYQKILPLRLNSTSCNFVILDGT